MCVSKWLCDWNVMVLCVALQGMGFWISLSVCSLVSQLHCVDVICMYWYKRSVPSWLMSVVNGKIRCGSLSSFTVSPGVWRLKQQLPSAAFPVPPSDTPSDCLLPRKSSICLLSQWPVCKRKRISHLLHHSPWWFVLISLYCFLVFITSVYYILMTCYLEQKRDIYPFALLHNFVSHIISKCRIYLLILLSFV